MMYGNRLLRGVLAAAVCLSPACLFGQVVLPPGVGVPGGQTVPSPGFDLALSALAAGDFSAALEIASREYRGGVRAGGQQWIDSIAAAAVVGECHFELGNLREAVAAYDDALRLSAIHGEWLRAVQFPPQGLRPMPQQRGATWGRSQRNVTPALIPAPMSIRQQGADPQRVLQQGGVLAGPVNFPVRPQEIMRAIVFAIYRRSVILGESGRDGMALDEATKALLRRPALPNHYSQSWIDVALGAALWAQGKPDDAQPLLNRGLLVGNQYDHPLTSWALIVLGRIALDADQPAVAAGLFEEATYTAADYGDARALEEAFRLVATASLAAGARGLPASVRGATDWAKHSMPLLRAGLLGLQAEAAATAGNAQAAADTLAEIDGRLLRGDPGRGQVGAQQAYAAALTAYASGNVATGDRELDRALAIARGRSPTLFRTQRLVEAVLAGGNGVSDRQADASFARLLGDPTAHDVTIDPLDGLAALCTSRSDAFDAWVSAAARRGDDAVLNAAEAAARSRWLVSQPLGGRRTAATRLLSTDPAGLPPAEAARRAAVVARHPELPAVLDGMVRVRTALTAALLGAREPNGDATGAVPGDMNVWREYRQLVTRFEPIVACIAAGRDAVPVGMPPLTQAAEIRRRLPAKHLILSFHWTTTGLLAALESHDHVRTWTVKQPATVTKEIAGLSKALSLFDPSAPVATDRLLAGEWQAVVERIERLLFENSKVTLAEGVEELVIVPDGMLWYLPFELLPAGSARPPAGGPTAAEAAGGRRLRDVCRIRYCPTRSLAVLPAEATRGGGPAGIYAGRLMRGDKPPAVAEVAARFVAAVDRGVSLSPSSQGPPTPLVASILDTLVVAEEVSLEAASTSRPFVTTVQGKPAMTFGEWLEPPTKRPRCVVMPGTQTPMAGGLAKVQSRPGEEIFLAVTSLMAAGGRTVLLSRWRTGGKSSVDLAVEFLRDRVADGEAGEHPPAAESWQRAVDIVTEEQPDLAREPRLRQAPDAILTDMRHPFFWAGFILADCGEGRFPEPPPPAPAGQQPAPAVRPPAVPQQRPPAAQPAVPQRPLNPAAPP